MFSDTRSSINAWTRGEAATAVPAGGGIPTVVSVDGVATAGSALNCRMNGRLLRRRRLADEMSWRCIVLLGRGGMHVVDISGGGILQLPLVGLECCWRGRRP